MARRAATGAGTAVVLALLAALLALPPLAAADATPAQAKRVNGTCELLGCSACKVGPGAVPGATLATCTKCTHAVLQAGQGRMR